MDAGPPHPPARPLGGVTAREKNYFPDKPVRSPLCPLRLTGRAFAGLLIPALRHMISTPVSILVLDNLLGDLKMSSIVKVCDKPALVITAFDKDLFSIIHGGYKARETTGKKIDNLVFSKHKDVLPTFADYEHTNAALTHLAADKGLSKETDYFHRLYRDCLITRYGALPVSMDKETRAKYITRLEPSQTTVYDKSLAESKAAGIDERVAVAQAVRAVKSVKKQAKQETAGAPKGETKDQVVSPQIRFEQMIASLGAHGVFIAIDAVVAVLAAEKSTEDKAKALVQLRNNLAKQLKLADATPVKQAA
jgi:hypothetical protein